MTEAIKCRRDVIGAYASLLGEIFVGNSSRCEGFVHDFMYAQIWDDLTDIREDRHTQMNPFVALLESEGLMQEYLDTTEKEASRELYLSVSKIHPLKRFRENVRGRSSGDLKSTDWLDYPHLYSFMKRHQGFSTLVDGLFEESLKVYNKTGVCNSDKR